LFIDFCTCTQGIFGECFIFFSPNLSIESDEEVQLMKMQPFWGKKESNLGQKNGIILK
jgi:hypothetical protein